MTGRAAEAAAAEDKGMLAPLAGRTTDRADDTMVGARKFFKGVERCAAGAAATEETNER
jgi:hypothetical protein